MLLCLPLLSQQLQLCASPPLFRVFGVSFHPPGFLLRLLSCAPSPLYSTWVFFFFLVSFLWFWVSLSSFLLLSPLLEPSLPFFFVVCQVPAGGRSCNTTQKKKIELSFQQLQLCASPPRFRVLASPSSCFSSASSVLRSLNSVLYLGFFLFPGFLSLVLGLLEQLPFAFSCA